MERQPCFSTSAMCSAFMRQLFICFRLYSWILGEYPKYFTAGSRHWWNVRKKQKTWGASLKQDKVNVLITKLMSDFREGLCNIKPIANLNCRKLWQTRPGHPINAIPERMAKWVTSCNDPKGKGDSVHSNVCLDTELTKAFCFWSALKEDQDHVSYFDPIGPFDPIFLWKARLILAFIVKSSKFANVFMIQSFYYGSEGFQVFETWLECIMLVTANRVHTDQELENVSMSKRTHKEGNEHIFSADHLI